MRAVLHSAFVLAMLASSCARRQQATPAPTTPPPSVPVSAEAPEAPSSSTSSEKAPLQPASDPPSCRRAIETLEKQRAGRHGPMPRPVALPVADGGLALPEPTIRMSLGPDWVAMDGFRGRIDAEATPASAGRRASLLADRRRRLGGHQEVHVVVFVDRSVRIGAVAPVLRSVSESGILWLAFTTPDAGLDEPPKVGSAPAWYATWSERWRRAATRRARLVALQDAWSRFLSGCPDDAVRQPLAASEPAGLWATLRSTFQHGGTCPCERSTRPLFEPLVALSGALHLGPRARGRKIRFGAPGEARPRMTSAGPLTEQRTMAQVAASLESSDPIVLAEAWGEFERLEDL